MHLLLLRSLLREMITDLAGPSSTGDEPNRESMTRYLIVVARTEPAVYEHLRNRHVGDPKVKVVLDRRGAPDAESMDGPPPVDRRHRRSSLTAGASHELVAVTREDTVEASSPNPQPLAQYAEAPRQMSQIETIDDAQRLTRWLAESQYQLSHTIPSLIEDRESLRRSLEAREQEGRQPRGAIGRRRPAAEKTSAAAAPELDTAAEAPERAFAARRPRPAPEPPPPPANRHAIFFDVENTSNPGRIGRVLDRLTIDRRDRRTEFFAVGNWRVIGPETARLLARHGAQLVHSAPSAGVRDWSDLRIAVSAGVWLAVARPGDVLEVVSDDRAFDAVGDVAAALGITFHRVTSRAIGEASEPAPAQGGSGSDRGRRRGRRGRRGRPAPVADIG